MSNSSFQSNTLSNYSYFNLNTLSNSYFQLNTLSNNSYFYANTLSNSSFQSNTLSGSSILQFTGTLSSKQIARLTMIGNITSISSSATIIFNPNISKTIFKREDGTSRLQYVNEFDVIVITDLNT